MKDTTRQYRDGEVIFREGDASLAVFVVRKGRVRLVKSGANGGVVLATLGKDEMFGEMGILDGVGRTATAVAEGAVSAVVVPRRDFLDRLQKEPDLAYRVMLKLVERLRAADERLARAAPPDALPQAVTAEPEPAPAPADAVEDARRDAPAKAGLLTRLFGRNKGEAAEAPPPQGPLKVLIARFSDAPPEAAALLETLSATLHLIPGALVRRIDDAVAWPEGVTDPEAARLAAAQSAAALLASRGGDVLVWGRHETIGHLLEVRVAGAAAPHELRLGRVPPVAGVFVPMEAMVEPLPALIRAMTVAAALAEGGRRDAEILACLADDVLAAAEGLKRAVAGLAAAEQASAMVAWGCAAALAAGGPEVPEDLWALAAKTFDEAARRLPRTARHDWADVFIGRALLDCAHAERGGEAPEPPATPWDGPADGLRLALEGVRREERPWDWALLNERLGLVTYRQALASGDEAHFKAALAHYQAAIQVYTRTEFPQKWADIVSALAQALQVYGNQLASVPALERAVELSRAALEVRTEESAPLLWAATQNTLGSALFLLAKRRDDAEAFQAAADAFRAALGAYQVNGQARPAAIVEKNLARAEQACRGRARRDEKRAQPEWADGAPREDVP
ncbi:MAG: Crp/Fnr family transcriptional regulator [Rhodospirillaceae bacterium]